MTMLIPLQPSKESAQDNAVVTEESAMDSLRTLFVEDINLWINPTHLPLFEEIVQELANPEFQDCMHGTLSTRNKRCDGPLCRRALRLHQRAYRERKKAEKRRTGDARRFNQGRPRRDDAEYLLKVLDDYHRQDFLSTRETN